MKDRVLLIVGVLLFVLSLAPACSQALTSKTESEAIHRLDQACAARAADLRDAGDQ